MPVWLHHTLRQAAWAPLLVFFAYLIAAKGFQAYLLYPSLTMPTYFLGGMAITYFYLTALYFAQLLIGATPRLIQQIAALGLSALTAIFWEFSEIIGHLTVGARLHVGDNDALAELFFAIFGATMMVLFAKRPPRLLPDEH
jgi:hypothetical protein